MKNAEINNIVCMELYSGPKRVNEKDLKTKYLRSKSREFTVLVIVYQGADCDKHWVDFGSEHILPQTFLAVFLSVWMCDICFKMHPVFLKFTKPVMNWFHRYLCQKFHLMVTVNLNLSWNHTACGGCVRPVYHCNFLCIHGQ
jgi:hypothetical protein